ncbi:MAG: cation diffusion facilitator family transporter [Gemmataceae bacterium]
MVNQALRGAMRYSILAAIVTIALKFLAYFQTSSAGLLADALESFVNLLAAGITFYSLHYAARPADETHAFGHQKIQFFASGFEGALILMTGLSTSAYGIFHLWHPAPLHQLWFGAALALIAAILNFIVAKYLLRIGRQEQSPAVVADGHHLMSDFVSSISVVIGLGIVSLTQWYWLDSILAIAVGGHILWIGYRLLQEAFDGLMDRALPNAIQEELRGVIRTAIPPEATFHALRTRTAGQQSFADFHLLVSGTMIVAEAHALAHEVEAAIHSRWPTMTVSIHIEPIEDSTSWEQTELEQLGEQPCHPQSGASQ